MTAQEIYRELARIPDPVERQATCDWASALEEMSRTVDRGGLGAAVAALAGRMGVSRQTAQRKWCAWKKGGPAALVNRAKLPKPVARHSWESVFMKYCENDLNTSSNAWRRMMTDFRAGRAMEGVGTWRDCWRAERPFEAVPDFCPPDFVPAGASLCNLRKACRANPDWLFSIAVSRQGRKAAQRFLLPVLKTRLGLPVGAMTEYDDVWHNTDVLMPGMAKAVQPMEFAGYDVASGFKRSSLVKPRFERADGRRDNLKEQQFRFLFAFDHVVAGFHRDGVTDIVEHGTTAIREKVRRQIAAIPGYGRLIDIRDSGILSEQAHAGLFIGNGGGNFRLKALCEGAHGIMHNRLASLPGSRGRDAEHLHESRDALVKYEERLAAAAAKLPPDLAAYIEAGLLTFDQYMEAFRAIEASLMDDPEHRLEGWAGREVAEYSLGQGAWRKASELLDMGDGERAAIAAFLGAHPECRRVRPMSRREAWAAGQKDLVRVPDWEMPAFLDAEKDAVELTVRDNGLVGIRSEMWFGRDEMLYQAGAMKDRDGYVRAIPPRTRILAEFNPLVPGKIWVLSKEDGRTLGVCPVYNRAPAYDRRAVEAAMGAQAHDLASKLLPLRGRHQEEAENRARRLAANRAILAGAASPGPLDKVPLVPVPAGAGAERPADIGELAGAPAAEDEDYFPGEDDADGVADFLAGITTTQGDNNDEQSSAS